MKTDIITWSEERRNLLPPPAARWVGSTVATFLFLPFFASPAAPPLTRLEYRIAGVQLQAAPSQLSVPKGLAGSVAVDLVAGAAGGREAAQSFAEGAHVEALLRGPSFPARKLLGLPNEPLMLPPLNLVGDYQLDGIRLVDSATGVVRFEAQPSSIRVRVFDEVLISRVTSRPLSMQEIQEKGITIDESSFQAVEFEVAFVLEGQAFPVKFPVVSPTFSQQTEVIPRAEREAQLAQAEMLNQNLARTVSLPPALQAAGLNFDIQPINFQRVEGGADAGLDLEIPPIPALMVIPGNIGFLHQFFSVMIYTANGSPSDSGLSVRDVSAQLKLPAGEDRTAGTYEAPGDDPLRFARVGADARIHDTASIVCPGADGKLGTADDYGRLQPAETGQAEFLVEGLREGLHLMDVELTAMLDGFAAGPVQIKGRAAGSVLVRNPNFSLAFSHPRTVRAGEPYTASVTILNTSLADANEVSVTLPAASVSGAVLESDETVLLGTIKSGETKTAEYRLRSQRTGSITFSNLSGDDDVTGRFRLRTGVDERGVALSPAAIGYPDFVQDLPAALLAAADRVLGQALSVATAGRLPAGVKALHRSTVERRAVELAEAGQRLRYGDTAARTFVDLLLDWQGGRWFDPGFDQIARGTEAGREFRETAMAALAAADGLTPAARLAARGPDIAGRGEVWFAASADSPALEPALAAGTDRTGLDRGALERAAGYRATNGHWLVAGPQTNAAAFLWIAAAPLADPRVFFLRIDTNGTGALLEWRPGALPRGARCEYAVPPGNGVLNVDTNADGAADAMVFAAETPVRELAPQPIAAVQDLTVTAGRPPRELRGCLVPDLGNYGSVVAVLFSKPMRQEDVNKPGAYVLDNGVSAQSVQIQPGARVALVNLRSSVGSIRSRTLALRDISDRRGNAMQTAVLPVLSAALNGVAVLGRVIRANGAPATNAPVTLTMYDQIATLDGECWPLVVRAFQLRTDREGRFAFDFVPAGIPYSISATDVAGLGDAAVEAVLAATSGDRVQREKLEQLANSPSARGTLLGAFAVGSLPEAVAVAEGLDRAMIRDLVGESSPRIGTETVVALRFRGRATVIGAVVGPDGASPVSGAAVNLFPDPDSRELGRGLFSDASGRFAFLGVPLGVYTVEALLGSDLRRTVSGLLERPGETNDVTVVLTRPADPARSAIQGWIFEANGQTPHAAGRAFVGRFGQDGRLHDVVAATSTDSAGAWSAADVPVGTWDLLAVSCDGKRQARRLGVAVVENVVTYVNLNLQGRTTVRGRVQFANGQPAVNAVVAGGEVLVNTDVNGSFALSGVPTGLRTISAGIEKNPDAGIPFSRIGNSSLDVIDGADNFVTITFEPRGRITGRVFDAEGRPVPRVRVALPWEDGFYWTDADADGRYAFDNQPLAEFTVSAPSGGVAENDVGGILNVLTTSGSEEEIMAAIDQAFAIFTGANDPYLRGETASFNPGTWGFARTRLTVDGQTVVADIQFLPTGTISGIVKNGMGVPIGARVRLTGVGPTPAGAVGFIVRGECNTDPALGTFAFNGQAFAGPWGLQAASPFFPAVISTSGHTTPEALNVTNVVLQFPPERVTNGRLTGRVFGLDGLPVGANVNVKISFGDLTVRTDSNGLFDTRMDLPAVSDGGQVATYSIEADDPATGLKGLSYATLTPGTSTYATVHLIGKGGLAVTVTQTGGAPAARAQVAVRGGAFPNEMFQGTTDDSGQISFANMFEGPYAIEARWVTGLTTVQGRGAARVPRGGVASATLVLTPTATVRGTFVERDLSTPVPFARVVLGDLGFASTDAAGRFEIHGVPLGAYRLTAQDPLTGRAGVQDLTLETAGGILDVVLVERSLGTVAGGVISSRRDGYVAGASVTLSMADGITPPRTVTSGPDGRFSFPGAPAGRFTLRAVEPAGRIEGEASGTLPDDAQLVTVDVPLAGLASVRVAVFRPDGTTPATNATVTLGGLTADTDAGGRVAFADLLLREYPVSARSRAPGETHSVTGGRAVLSEPGQAPDVRLVLRGVGSVTGHVFAGDGRTAIEAAQITLTELAPLIDGESRVMLTDTNGAYRFENVAVGAFRLTARHGLLGSGRDGELRSDGEVAALDLTLMESGTVSGRLVRADGVTPVSNAELTVSFAPFAGLAGVALAHTATNGVFTLKAIPRGTIRMESIVPAYNGIARAGGTIATNGHVLDLGNVALDEEDPFVVSVWPPNGTSGVPVDARVELTFNEALDPATVFPDGIYIRAGTLAVAAAVELLADPGDGVLRRVRIAPDNRLASETTHEVLVINGDRVNATGQTVGRGPRDRVGRPLRRLFSSSFATRDQEPPRLLSMTPTNGAVQVDPRSVLRMAFSEPLRATGAVVRLVGPNGPVAGTVDVGVNQQVLAFTPTLLLEANAVYTGSVDNVRDVAGNRATNLPFVTTFWTLDTLGPSIASLRVRGAPRLTEGSTVTLDATLTVPERDARVKMSAGLVPIGETAAGDLDLPFVLPAPGPVTVRAIAIDRYGNEGPFVELPLLVVPNQPPQVQFSRIMPPAGPVPTGSRFEVDVTGTDDGAVSQVRVAVTGAVNVPLRVHTGDTLRVAADLPAGAGPDPKIRIEAEAIDDSGRSSGVNALTLDIQDATAPAAVLLLPAPGALLDPDTDATVRIRAWDNFGLTQATVRVTGAFTAQVQRAIGFGPGTNVFDVTVNVPPSVPADGAPVRVSASVSDAAGFSAGTGTNLLAMRDRTPPAVLTLSPTNGASFVPLACVVEIRFSEALLSNTVNGTTVALERETDGSNVAVRVEPLADGKTVRVIPSASLDADVTYRLALSTGITDKAGNPLPAGFVSTFRTTTFRVRTPLAGSYAIEGQTLRIEAGTPDNAGIRAVRFFAGADPLGRDDSAPFSVTHTVPTLASLGTTALVYRAEALDAADAALATATSTVYVLSGAGDADGDGITNRVELQWGLDPFADDAGLDPDGDGLASSNEIAIGTHPLVADTDGDAANDRLDPRPLTPNAPPVAGQGRRGWSLRLDGVNDFAEAASPPAGFSIGTQSWSVSAWVYAEPGVSRAQAIVGRSERGWATNGSPDGSASALYALSLDATGRGVFSVRDDSNALRRVAGASDLRDRVWHHLAGVLDRTRDRVTLYVDGQRQAETNVAGLGPIRDAGSPLAIGRTYADGNGAPTNQFQGMLDEIRIWSRPQSHAEIRQGMRRTLDGTESGLIGYWTADEGGGEILYDRTAGVADLRLGNGAAASMPAWTNDVFWVYEDERQIRFRDSDVTLFSPGNDPDSGPSNLPCVIVSLPSHGRLFSTWDGWFRASEITNVPFALRFDPRVLYAPDPGFTGRDSIRYARNDGQETAEAPGLIDVLPVNENLPAARADTVRAFEAVTTPLNVLANDTDADGETVRIVCWSQPTNGVVIRRPDGDLEYTPNPGFRGRDAFTYVVADGISWNRAADFTPGVEAFGLQGNPDGNSLGLDRWQAEYTGGGGLGSTAPWYAVRGARPVWDPSFGGGSGQWAKGDDAPPAIGASALRHATDSAARWEFAPLARWLAPVGLQVAVVGDLGIRWAAGATGPVDVAIVATDAQDRRTLRYSATVDKPAAAEEVRLPVMTASFWIAEGSSIAWSLRAQQASDAGWVELLDGNLHIVRDAGSSRALVTVDVQTNALPVTTAPQPRWALRFDGTNDHVRITSGRLHGGAQGTMEAWIYPMGPGSGTTSGGTILCMEGEYLLARYADGTIRWAFANDDPGWNQVIYTGSNAPEGRWTHVAVVGDGATGKVLTYINGVLKHTYNGSGATRVQPTTDFRIGGRGAVSQNFDGIIDEVRLWGVCRSVDQIRADMWRQVDGSAEPALAGYWRMDEGAGTTAFDSAVYDPDHDAALGGGVAAEMPVWAPSFAPFESAVLGQKNTDLALVLDGTDGDSDPLRAFVVQRPAHGTAYQTPDGATRGDAILAVPAAVTHADRRIVYAPETNYVGVDFVTYLVNDGKVDSAAGTLPIRVRDGAVGRPAPTGVAPVPAGSAQRWPGHFAGGLSVEQDALAATTLRVRSERLDGAVTDTAPFLVLSWTAEPGREFAVSTSRDLRTWIDLGVRIEELSPGSYTARLPTVIVTRGRAFFRVREN